MIAGELKRMPFIRLAIPVFLGIDITHGWSIGSSVWFRVSVALFVGFAIAVFARRYFAPWVAGLLLSSFAFAIGAFLQSAQVGDKPPPGSKLYEVLILNTYGRSENVQRTLSSVSSLDNSYRFRALITFAIDSSSQPTIGDRLVGKFEVDGKTPVSIPGLFDRRSWMDRIGARGSAYCALSDYRFMEHQDSFSEMGKKHRATLTGILEDAGITGRNLAVAQALLLGDRSDLSTEQQTQFRESGTVHVLAVSGLHVGLIYLVLILMLKPLVRIKRGKVIQAALAILGLWSYAWITGATPSVMRAAAMFSIFAVASASERHSYHLNSLAIAALAILLVDPLMAFSLGFRLSFLAVLGIIIFYRPVFAVVPISSKWLDRIWALATVSIVAQLATAPLSMHEFGAFPVFFLPANVIVVGIVTVLVQLGAAVFVLWQVPFVGEVVTSIFDTLLTVLDAVTRFFSQLPGAYLPVRVDPWQVLVLYSILLILAIARAYRVRSRILLVSLISVLLVQWGIKVESSYSRHQLIVHQLYQGFVITELIGRELIVHGMRNERSIDLVEHYRRGVGASLIAWHEPTMESGLLEIDDSCTLLTGSARLDLGGVKGCELLVLGADLSWKKREYVRSWAQKNSMDLHDIRLNGPFVE